MIFLNRMLVIIPVTLAFKSCSSGIAEHGRVHEFEKATEINHQIKPENPELNPNPQVSKQAPADGVWIIGDGD